MPRFLVDSRAPLCRSTLTVILMLAVAELGTSVAGASNENEAGARQPSKNEAAHDRYGDPLPPGAVARIGTMRLRHSDKVYSLAFSADGTRITSAARGSVSVWDALSGRPVSFRSFSRDHIQVGPTVSPNGTLVAHGLKDDAVCVIEAISGKERCTLPSHKRGIKGLAFSNDHRWLAWADNHGTVSLWDAAAGKVARQWKSPPDEKNFSGYLNAFTPDGKFLVNATPYGTIVLWDLKTGNQLFRIKPRKDKFGLYGLAVSPDGRMLATRFGQRFELWQIPTGQFVREIPAKHSVDLAFSPDGAHLVWGTQSGEICFWNLAKEAVVRQLLGPECRLLCLAFSPSGRYLACGTDDHAVHVWDLDTGKEMFPSENGVGGSAGVRFLADGKTLFAHRAWRQVNFDEFKFRIGFWDMKGEYLRHRTFDVTNVLCFDISPDASTVALADSNGLVRLRDIASGKDLMHMQIGQPVHIDKLQFSPEGGFLLIWSVDILAKFEGVRLWKRTSNTSLEKINEFSGSPYYYALASQWIGIQRVTKTALSRAPTSVPGWRFFKWETGKSFRHYPKLLGRVSAASPSGRVLVFTTPGLDPPVLVEMATGNPIRKLECAAMRMDSCHFAVSPNGRTVAAGVSGNILLWEVCSGKQIGKLEGHRGSISSLCFSPDGRFLVSGGGDTTILIWDCTKIIPKPAPSPADVAPKDLEQYWQDLQANDAEHAYRAMSALVGAQAKAVTFLRTRIKPATAEDHRQIQLWIDDLGKDSFQVRSKAAAELEKMGELAEPVLRQALSRPLSVETNRRIGLLLENIAGGTPPSAWLRTLRTLDTLELIGTPEARKLVEELSRGLPESRQTQEACSSLERMDKIYLGRKD